MQTVHPLASCGDAPYVDGWREGSWAGFSSDFADAPPWYFRTLASWVALFLDSGLRITSLREPLHPDTGKPVSLILMGQLPDDERPVRTRMRAGVGVHRAERFSLDGTRCRRMQPPTRCRQSAWAQVRSRTATAKKKPVMRRASILLRGFDYASGSITKAGIVALSRAPSRNLSAVISASLMVTSMSR